MKEFFFYFLMILYYLIFLIGFITAVYLIFKTLWEQ